MKKETIFIILLWVLVMIALLASFYLGESRGFAIGYEKGIMEVCNVTEYFWVKG